MLKQNNYRLRTVFCTLVVVSVLSAMLVINLILVLSPKISAAPTTYLNFQGRLKTASGAVVPDGNYNLEFKIYDHESAGNLLWTETRTGGNRVRVANGYFSVSLGSVTAFPGTIDWSEEHWITMNVGGTDGTPSWDGEMTNAGVRMILTAVPYAFQADKANTANALTDGTNDYTADDFLRIAPGTSQGTNSSTAAVRLNQTGSGGLLQLQSSGSDVLSLSNGGQLTLSGVAPDGPTSSIATITGVVNSSGSDMMSGLLVSPDITVSSSSDIVVGGIFAMPSTSTNNLNQTDSVLIGMASTPAYVGTGTLSNLIGYAAGTYNVGNGTIGSAIGMSIQNPINNGTINYSIGLDLRNQSVGTNNTNIYIGEPGSTPSGNYSIYNASPYANHFAGVINAVGGLTIGTSDTTGTLLVLDTKTDSGDPTGVNGGMYYNSDAGKFRCYENGSWKDCISGGGSLFTDGGTATYLTSTSDNLTIGATTDNSAKLSVVNSADQAIISLTAHSTQTSPILAVYDSSSNLLSSTYMTADKYQVVSSGSQNYAFGGSSSFSVLSTGNYNFAFGGEALRYVTSGVDNIALGRNSARNTADGIQNFAVSRNALYTNVGGSNNIAIGRDSLYSNVSGNHNIALGLSAGEASTGNGNIFLGRQAGDNLTSGNNNIAIGYQVDLPNTTGNNQLNIAGILHSSNYTTGNLNIGTSDTTGQLLVLDTKTSSGDPTGVNGGMYYNSNSGKFRCYEDGEWKDCIASGTGDVVNGGQNGTVTLGTNDANTLTLETNNQSAMTIASGGAVTFQNATNSTDALQVRRADGSSMIQVDTENGRIGFNVPSWASLDYSFQAAGYASGSQSYATFHDATLEGSTTTSQTGHYFNTHGPNNNSSDWRTYYGINNQIGVTPNGNTDTLSYVGMSTTSNSWSETGNIHQLIGFQSWAGAFNDGTVNRLVAIESGRSVSADAEVGESIGVEVRDSDGSGTTEDNYGIFVHSQTAGDNNYGIYVQGASGGTGANYALFVEAGESRFNGQVTIGTSDTTGTLLVLDTKTDSGDPTGVNGAMYYNSDAGKFRCYEDGSWKDCIAAGGGDVVNGGQNGALTIGTNDNNTLGFETNGTTRWNINSSGHLLPDADDTYDIGSDTLRVRDIYVGPSSIHIGESGDEVVLSFDTVNDVLNVNQSLSVQGDIISNGTSLNLNVDGTQDVNIAAGTSTGNVTIGNANSGDVSIYSSGTVGLYGNGGSVGIEVGSVFGLSVNTMQFSGTGTKNIRTSAQGSGHSAGFDIYTGNVTGGTNRQTGDISIRSGNGSGTTTNSGSITIDTGTATGTAGTISIGAANTSNLILGRNGINVNVGGNLVIGTSDTTGTLLVLDTKTDSGDPTGVAGGMYYNSNTGKFRCYENGAWKNCISGISLAVASTAPSNTISGTTAETNFSGTGNNYVIPASSCTVGKTYRVTATGVQSFAGRVTGSEATILSLKLGSTTLATTGWTWFGDSAFTDQMWKMEAQFTCTAAPSGSSAIEAQGIVQFFTSKNNPITYSMTNTSTVNAATNADQTLQISAQIFNNADAGDSITMRQFIVEEMN